MRIGIIGSGNVGGTLGKRWSKGGHPVYYATRGPKSAAMQQLLAESAHDAKAGAIDRVVTESDLLLVASPWPATQQMLEAAGDFAGKVLIDATNPIAPDFATLECANTTSGGE